MEPTIYKPSIYNGAGIYKAGGEGGQSIFKIFTDFRNYDPIEKRDYPIIGETYNPFDSIYTVSNDSVSVKIKAPNNDGYSLTTPFLWREEINRLSALFSFSPTIPSNRSTMAWTSIFGVGLRSGDNLVVWIHKNIPIETTRTKNDDGGDNYYISISSNFYDKPIEINFINGGDDYYYLWVNDDYIFRIKISDSPFSYDYFSPSPRFESTMTFYKFILE